MNIEVLSRGESRHEILEVEVDLVTSGPQPGAKAKIAAEDEVRLMEDPPESVKALSSEYVEWPLKWRVTLVAFWRLGEDPS